MFGRCSVSEQTWTNITAPLSVVLNLLGGCIPHLKCYMKCISPILTVLSRTQTNAKCFYKRFMSVFYIYFKLIYVNHSFTVPFPSGHTHFSVYKVNAWMQHKDCAESGPFWISFCLCLSPGVRLIGFGNLSRHVLSSMSEIDSISQREVCNTMD